MPRRLDKNKVTDILDAVSPGISYNKIAKIAGASASSAFHILKEFPLWSFIKDKKPDTEE